MMNRLLKRGVSLILSAAMVFTLCPQTQLFSVNAAESDDTPYVISKGRPVYASSQNGDGSGPEKAVDDDITTRWQAAQSDKDEWFYVDLGKKTDIDSLEILWEASYAKSYKIQFSDDEETWKDVYKVGNTTEPTETESVSETESSEDESKEPSVMKIKSGDYYYFNNTYLVSDLSWDAVDGAATYKIYVNDRDTYAMAGDGFTFDKEERLNLLNQVRVLDGVNTYIVVAYDVNKNEIASGSIVLDSSKAPAEETTTQGTEEITTKQAEEDHTHTVIDFKKILTNANDRKARYVRFVAYERAMGYGSSFFEFKVYGTDGVVKRPTNYGENIALNKQVECSGITNEWWMKDDDGNIKPDQLAAVKATNAVDGSEDTAFKSNVNDNAWFYVDLGANYEIGRVIIKWGEDAGKIYDIDVSEDKEKWTTLYRRFDGAPDLVDNVTLYVKSARYVRMQGHSKVSNGAGYAIKEFEVYPYKQGDEKKTYTVKNIPESSTKQVGSGSYVVNNQALETAKLPIYIDTDNVKVPIASNDWWQSAMIKKFGNTMSTLPFKTGYSKKGLSLLTTTAGWMPSNMTDTTVNVSTEAESTPDMYILPENLDGSTAYDRVHNYGDYSVDLQLCDENGVAMTSTHVKGSPYIYATFNNKENISISSSSFDGFFDDDGNAILSKGTTITTDHIGVKITDSDNKEKTKTSTTYYCISFPENTRIKNIGSSLKVSFEDSDQYLSVGTMTKESDLETFYEHGYAFVTGTSVTYEYNDSMSKITSKYDVKTKVVRDGFSDVTMQLMLPHQWKKSAQNKDSVATYSSSRGDMHGIWLNHFETQETFEGLLPTFAMPTNSEFDHEKVKDYLNTLKSATSNINPAADAYWEGKNLHPLAMGVLMADQIGDTELRDLFTSRLRERYEDWFTYSGEDDVSYLIYDEHWGTIYYKQSEFGANWGICDHHFTYGYFIFGATVLATYDKDFYEKYKDMIEILMRDYANPSDKDSEYCRFRAYDLYEGHSWAGGYADNDNGNNQESASESLFSWVSMYLWGVLTEADTYRDAGVFGFTNEMEAIKQYWFNYDGDNWIKDYPYQVVAQVYGTGNFFGTFFGGQPLYCYGIQWLPVSEYLTYYGTNQKRAAEIYAGLEKDTEDAKAKSKLVSERNIEKYEKALKENPGKIEEYKAELAKEDTTEARKKELNDLITTAQNGINEANKGLPGEKANLEKIAEGRYESPDNGWQHITWPFLSQTNPTLALQKFNENAGKVQNTDQANTYWFINSMLELGSKTDEIIATGDLSASVYCRTEDDKKKYTANVWNPCSTAKVVTFKNKSGDEVGKATVAAKSLVKFDVTPEDNKNIEYSQLATPTIKVTSLSGGTTEENVSGTKEYKDTQLLELSSSDEGAKIYYTTDGSVPTEKSKEYKVGDKILVSSNMTVKAVSIKEGYISSSYASANFIIKGDAVVDDTNLAKTATADASSQGTENSADKAIDGNVKTRWESNKGSDDEWLQLDLGSVKAINSVKINWEAAYATEYKIQVSQDGKTWKDVAVEQGKQGKVTTEFAAVEARYVRMQGVSRVTDGYGYSIYEFEVYGALKASKPTISLKDGIYEGEQTVTLSTTVKGAEIKYTLDGSEPTKDSLAYTEPLKISTSKIVRAVTYRKGMTLSDEAKSKIIIKGTVSLNKRSEVIAIGRSVTLEALTDQNVTWSSSNGELLRVDDNGNVKALKVEAGKEYSTVTIRATITNGKSAECEFKVIPAIPITGIEMSESELKMRNFTKATLLVSILPEDTTDDKTVTWTSSKDDIVEVNSKGVLTAKAEGEALITAKVGNHEVTCKVTVTPAATFRKMISDGKYNLALKKEVELSGTKSDGDGTTPDKLTDGLLSTAYCAVTSKNGSWGENESSYAIIDLGKYYDASKIDKILIAYKDDQANAGVVGKSYSVFYSEDGINFDTVAVNNRKIASADDFTEEDENNKMHATVDDVSNVTGTVRYVKVYFPKGATYGMQIKEIAVIDKNLDAEPLDITNPVETPELSVESNDLNSLTYTIASKESQKDYKYYLYLDGSLITDNATAGTHTLNSISAGEHTVAVLATQNDRYSDKAKKNVTVVGITNSEKIADTIYNLALNKEVTISGYKLDGPKTTPDKLTDGSLSTEYCAVTSKNESWGENKPSYAIIDLGQAYDADEIGQVIVAYKNQEANDTVVGREYSVSVSEDNDKYRTVVNRKVASADELDDGDISATVDTISLSEGKVRYVRIDYPETAGYGMQIKEIAVLKKLNTYFVSIDGVKSARYEGQKIKLPGSAKYGYYSETTHKMYRSDNEITVNEKMILASLNELTITTVDGAGVRITEPSGLRFMTKISSDNNTVINDDNVVKQGTLITTETLFNKHNNELTIDSVDGYTKLNVENSGWYKNKQGEYCASIVNIYEHNYKTAFVAKGYVSITYADGATEYVYSDTYTSRTINYVANAVIKAGYPTIGGGIMSDAQKEIINKFAN